MVVQLEDVFGAGEQANLPGTTEDQYPNWRRKLNIPLESWARTAASPRSPECCARNGDGGHRTTRIAPVARAGRAAATRDEHPARDLSPAAAPRLHVSPTPRALVPYLAELGISHVYCSPYLGARRQHARLRHRRPWARSIRRSAATRTSTRSSRRLRDTAWARCSTSCPTTWASWARQRVVAGRARERPRLALRRTTSTSTGRHHWPRSRTRCWCRCWATTTATCSSAASWSSSFDRKPASSHALFRAPLSARSARVPVYPARRSVAGCPPAAARRRIG